MINEVVKEYFLNAYNCSVYSGNTLYKNINGEIVGKPAMCCTRENGTTYIAWQEDITEKDLNLKYMNKDFTRK